MKTLLASLLWPNARINVSAGVEIAGSILGNLLPIVGILFFNWDAFPVLLFYCVESVILLLLKSAGAILSKHQNKTETVSMLFFVLVFLALAIVIPLTVVLGYAISGLNDVVDSIANISFVTSVFLLAMGLIIPGIGRIKSEKQVVKSIDDFLYFLFFRGLLIVAVAFFTVLNSYHPSWLIGMSLVKTFLDIRSIMRASRADRSGRRLAQERRLRSA